MLSKVPGLRSPCDLFLSMRLDTVIASFKGLSYGGIYLQMISMYHEDLKIGRRGDPVAIAQDWFVSSGIWGKSDSLKAAGILPPTYCKEAVKNAASKTILSHLGFAGWEMPFLCLVYLPCS